MIRIPNRYCLSEKNWKEEKCPQLLLFFYAEALVYVSFETPASMVLTVPHIDEVLEETIAGATSEDDMVHQPLCCFRSEAD